MQPADSFSFDPLEARDADRIAQATAQEIRDQTERLTARHAAYGSKLLRIYRSRTPPEPSWLAANSPVRRWIGSPLTLVGLISSTVLGLIEALTSLVPDGWGWRWIGGTVAVLLLRILYQRFSGRAASRVIDPRERAQACAEVASDCIAVGTTHIAYHVSGAFLDRTGILPLSAVVLTERAGAIDLTRRDGSPLVRIVNPWCARIARDPNQRATATHGRPSGPVFGQRG
jgi:hypothetical protein